MNDEMVKELADLTRRRYAEVEKDPDYQQMLAETRAECARIREEVKARRLARARKASASRWSGHVTSDWTTVSVPRALVADLRRLCPGLSISKAIQHLCDVHRGALSS